MDKYASHNLIMWCIFFIKKCLDTYYLMSKVNTNKKLELIKAIRMQNQYDRQLFRSREGFLYSDDPQLKHPELYSLENPERFPAQEQENGAVYGSFRIRFVIAVILLFCFILCDINHFSYEGENTDTIFERMTESFDLTGMFDALEDEPPAVLSSGNFS